MLLIITFPSCVRFLAFLCIKICLLVTVHKNSRMLVDIREYLSLGTPVHPVRNNKRFVSNGAIKQAENFFGNDNIVGMLESFRGFKKKKEKEACVKIKIACSRRNISRRTKLGNLESDISLIHGFLRRKNSIIPSRYGVD